MIIKKMMLWLFVWLIFICFFPLEAGGIAASWDANTEPDLAGYNVYIATTYDNVSQGIGDIYYFSTTETCFCYDEGDRDVVFLAVTAYNTAGLESDPTIVYLLSGNIWGTSSDGVSYANTRVDGQDLISLGLYFGSVTSHQEIDCSGTFVVELTGLAQRSDFNRSRRIDGLDLIELGLRFGNTAS